MDDSQPVGRGQGVSYLHRDPQRFVERQARSFGARACASALQRFPLQELHDEKRGAGFLADVEERADVRMGESRNGARFAVEAFAELRVGGQRLGEHLDRDGAIEARVSAFVHLAHAARADLRGNFVDAETGAGMRAKLVVDYTGGSLSTRGTRETFGASVICVSPRTHLNLSSRIHQSCEISLTVTMFSSGVTPQRSNKSRSVL